MSTDTTNPTPPAAPRPDALEVVKADHQSADNDNITLHQSVWEMVCTILDQVRVNDRPAIDVLRDALELRPADRHIPPPPPVPVISEPMRHAAFEAVQEACENGYNGGELAKFALNAALATVSPEPPAQSLDQVLAEIEGMGWNFRDEQGPWGLLAWPNLPLNGGVRGRRRFGDTPLAAAIALRNAIRSQAGKEVNDGN